MQNRRKRLSDYNIPSNNRELQHMVVINILIADYNIPSNNRELQLAGVSDKVIKNYNIPSNNRELQLSAYQGRLPEIITYQVITGNYSWFR